MWAWTDTALVSFRIQSTFLMTFLSTQLPRGGGILHPSPFCTLFAFSQHNTRHFRVQHSLLTATGPDQSTRITIQTQPTNQKSGADSRDRISPKPLPRHVSHETSVTPDDESSELQLTEGSRRNHFSARP